jgi:hypothetical protein
MIIDITAHPAFERHRDADENDDLLPLQEEGDSVIENLSRTYMMASQTVQMLRAHPIPNIVEQVTHQRTLIEGMLRNLEPLEPQLMRAGGAFVRRYRPLVNDLRRLTFEMEDAIRYSGTFVTVRLKSDVEPRPMSCNSPKSKMYNIAEIILLIVIGSTLIGAIRAMLG